jgi:hypothetical protein
MALGSTQPLTEMSGTEYRESSWAFLRGKGQPTRRADNLTAICEPIVCKMWDPRRLTTLWASTACYRDSFTFNGLFISHIADKQSELNPCTPNNRELAYRNC